MKMPRKFSIKLSGHFLNGYLLWLYLRWMYSQTSHISFVIVFNRLLRRVQPLKNNCGVY